MRRRRQSVRAAAAEAAEADIRIRALDAARARTPRIARASDETWDTLNVTLDPFHRDALTDALELLDVDLGLRDLTELDCAQWVACLEWLRTRPLQRPTREDS